MSMMKHPKNIIEDTEDTKVSLDGEQEILGMIHLRSLDVFLQFH